jgi:hypothetical protein
MLSHNSIGDRKPQAGTALVAAGGKKRFKNAIQVFQGKCQPRYRAPKQRETISMAGLHRCLNDQNTACGMAYMALLIRLINTCLIWLRSIKPRAYLRSGCKRSSTPLVNNKCLVSTTTSSTISFKSARVRTLHAGGQNRADAEPRCGRDWPRANQVQDRCAPANRLAAHPGSVR